MTQCAKIAAGLTANYSRQICDYSYNNHTNDAELARLLCEV